MPEKKKKPDYGRKPEDMSLEEYLRFEIKAKFISPPQGLPEFKGFDEHDAATCESVNIRSRPGLFNEVVLAISLYCMTCNYFTKYVYRRRRMFERTDRHIKKARQLIHNRVTRAEDKIKNIMVVLLIAKDEKYLPTEYEAQIVIGEHHGFISVCKLPCSED